MKTDALIKQIEQLSPDERRRVEESLHSSATHGASDTEEVISSTERVRRFDELMAKMPELDGRVDAGRESIYD